ncbi:hypothetical protein CAPTEDRAFT_182544 [Capitella teleta]|uniref:Dynein regulatory complex protein 1 n=1 Tax=Capitella teleta TaxID=283909 RepID=R7US70_CAPTE|nr:hypothetical protein CAPTEDRAFT_182544 [Capitella teleta]|eukprot:ELU08983.1 hypothetical protein CAPTEDRAFT_182544 [Capitella teleta]
MSSVAEEENTGPNVDSLDQEERIAARRVRIQKRLEAQKRAQLGEDPNEKKEVKEVLSGSRKQMEESRQRLTKLKQDGLELVSNIRVAGDAREASRRLDDEEVRRLRKEKLEAEAKAGAEKFEEITKKWETALQKEIPQELHEMLMAQKALCDGMIDEKNKLINDFQMELKQKDDLYVKDLKKQAEDVDLMIERMDEQVKQLTKAYREELGQVERAFVAERTDLLDTNRKKWDSTMKNRRDKEVEYMKSREKRVEDYENQLQHLRVQDAEEYNQVKIKLETDVQILQQQLQQMKATYQLNQEKLEYNFQVLRKRDEENTITKSQQKRKITRLQDVLTNLKIKLAKQEKTYRDENQQLSDEYKRITEQFRELQKKSKHFMATDHRKFHDIWVMNEDEAKSYVHKVLDENRVVHEQQLGLQYQMPDLEFLANSGPITNDDGKEKAIPASQIVQEIISVRNDSEKGELSERRSTILQKLPAKLVKSVLELLCDESGFLIESKLNKLLSPLEKDEQNLMKLDAIFTALGIETEDDIHLLSQYFLSHVDQTKPADGVSRKSSTAEVRQVTGALDKGEEGAGSGLPSPNQTQGDLVHPNIVLKVLRAFVNDNKRPPKEKGRNAQFQIASLDERDDSGDTEYWQKFPDVIPEQNERLWDALVDGLEGYHEVLTSRSGLITDNDSLRQQNAELRMLLHQYVNSKVNNELEIPPTRVLQLELNPPN